ncbi:MAG: XcyI family restriction endonuclease [Magnetococcales bacterium]|nr:XcyI family restriction endonuclease [Magnetococcales bacterium]
MTKKIRFSPPTLQIGFAARVQELRSLYLQDALLKTVRNMDIATIDQQLALFVAPADLAEMAQHGLRGELLFAVPAVLETNPYLLGYYRLLMGYSQKEFYGREKGFCVGHFKSMEETGKPSKAAVVDLPALCAAFCAAASVLLQGIGPLPISRKLLDDMTLLTVGPQLRGGANNTRGTDGIIHVFNIIKEIVSHAAVEVLGNTIKVNSPTGRSCLIAFAADPDIIIREEMGPNIYRDVVAIEIKSGTDISNIHNRIGEAEKSHQKARQRGFTECWTVVNVDRLDKEKAKVESPSTDQFFSLSSLANRSGDEYERFQQRIISLTAIPSALPYFAPPRQAPQ